MRILGIDTAIPTASVALLQDGELLAEKIHHRPSGVGFQPLGNHAEVVLPLIKSLFEKAQITVQQLSGIAVSIGPGSFTGLRIGLATAKGIAYDSGLPLVGVSTLHANAARVNDFEGVIASLLDARKSEVYLALFRRDKVTTTRLTSDSVVSLDSAVDLMREYCVGSSDDLLLVGDGAKAYERRLIDALGWPARTSSGVCYPSIASQVAMLGSQRLVDSSSADDAGALTPVYLRLSEAESKRKNLS
ncbi:MAG: tRNA (adenosine(37)-N6)-threonylcarbamoyltransferase complex dimerization subunit type 1 TsaB [Candidatus Binatia bacterium]